MKAEQLIKNYIMGSRSFTWISDIVEHTIWGFKGAKYKTFSRAVRLVESVVSRMVEDGDIEIDNDCIYLKR